MKTVHDVKTDRVSKTDERKTRRNKAKKLCKEEPKMKTKQCECECEQKIVQTNERPKENQAKIQAKKK